MNLFDFIVLFSVLFMLFYAGSIKATGYISREEARYDELRKKYDTEAYKKEKKEKRKREAELKEYYERAEYERLRAIYGK